MMAMPDRDSGGATGHGTTRAGRIMTTLTGLHLEIDARVCDCCQTDAAMTSEGAVLIYRDRSDDEIRDLLRRRSDTIYHPVGTCRMGVDAMAVVDPQLRVRGVAGLRVVDASVMPYVTNANIYSPTMMIAEKAADIIKGATPLPPEHTPFHVHQA